MTRTRILRLTFVLALGVRLAIIAASPRVNYYNTDLEIYRAGGALVHAGVNPYDPRDAVDLRARMREQTISPTFRLTQAYWDYYAAANLPLNLLVFGAIDVISAHPIAYRVAFALFDSVVAVLVMLYVLGYWRASRFEALVSGAALGAFSLVMWQWGVHSPQDKGIELLLIMAALLLSFSERRLNRVVFGPCFLGFSVAFKVIGGLLLPLCLVYAAGRSRQRRADLAVFSLVFVVSALIWNVPFVSDLPWMIGSRVTGDVGLPGHASPFQWMYPPEYLLTVTYIPVAMQRASYARIVVGVILAVIMAVGLVRRTISVETATAAMLLAFVWVVLVAGGPDRMNMGMVPAILLIGRNHPLARKVAVGFYVALGLISVTMGYALSLNEQRMEGLVIAIALVCLLSFLGRLAFGSRRPVAAAAPEPASAGGDGARVWPAAVAVCSMLLVVTLTASPHTRHEGAVITHWQANPFAAEWLLNEGLSSDRPGAAMPGPTMKIVQNEFPAYDDNALRSSAYRMTRVNEYTIDFEDRVDDRPVTGTMTTSLDSKTLTIEVNGTDTTGAPNTDVFVYDRMSGP